MTDQHVNSLYCRFCLDTGRQAKISDFYIIIESDFYPEYHPLKEYLESLPAWNGIDYIDQVASMVHVTGCEQEMHNRFFKQWLVAMVAAWLEPDKTNHEILTYIGPQGIYKSTFVRHLLPTELSGYFSTKNFALCMNRLGFEARRIRNVRGWNVVILTGNDIKEEQRLNAHRSVED